MATSNTEARQAAIDALIAILDDPTASIEMKAGAATTLLNYVPFD